jgi:hypothetical protein
MVIKNKIIVIFLVLLATAYACFAQAAPDPAYIAVGARPLGMGKAFVGLADDLGAAFLNPAGIANPERWQVTSMSGKLIDEFNYLSLSGLYPTLYGNFGLAYIGSSVGGAIPTTIEVGSDPADPIFVADGSELMSYYNNLLILSYGSKVESILKIPGLDRISNNLSLLKGINIGANLKMFSVNLTGDHITQGNASGNELDLGIQGKPLNWLSLGGALQNALPMSMGGKLHYDTGWDESYPALLKLGLSANVLGTENSLKSLGAHSVKLLFDLDRELTQSNMPTLLHLGLEWKPLDLFAIRVGIDQDAIDSTQVANNMTSGVGICYGDFRFDYAYHQFDSAPGVDNHFFSLSYGVAPPKKISDPLVSAPDKLITTNPTVKVEGTAVEPKIIRVRVSSQEAKMNTKGQFTLEVPLNIGKNGILVEGVDNTSKLISADKLRVLRLITYPDVAKDYWANDQISYIGTLGIIKGYPNGSFKPEGNITRAELATLLMRTKMGSDKLVPATNQAIFKDVSLKHWAVKYINLAASEKVVTGYPKNIFKPNDNVTRAEGLAMIARFGGVEKSTAVPNFKDVKPKYWAAPIIAGAEQVGMLTYLQGKPFLPNKKLTRAEAVEMLYRSQPVKLLIKDLTSFETGY